MSFFLETRQSPCVIVINHDNNQEQTVTNGTEIDIKYVQKQFFSLEKLLKEEIQHQLDYNPLEMYLSENIIPRGLRLRCEPSFTNDVLFVNEWQEYIHTCSTGLLKRLIIKREQLFTNIKKEISDILTDLEKFRTHKNFPAMDRLLHSRIVHFEKEVITKEIKKLNRDRWDYSNNNEKYWKSNPVNIERNHLAPSLPSNKKNGIHNTPNRPTPKHHKRNFTNHNPRPCLRDPHHSIKESVIPPTDSILKEPALISFSSPSHNQTSLPPSHPPSKFPVSLSGHPSNFCYYTSSSGVRKDRC